VKSGRAIVLSAFVLAGTACARPTMSGPGASASPAAASASPSTAASASPRPTASASALPTASASPFGYTISSKKVGSRYIYLTKQKANRKIYVLRADSETGQYFGGDTGRSDFVNPHVTFFMRDGSLVVADAPAGTLVEKDKTVTMRRGVHARTGDGKTLASDTMRYNDENETLFGDGDVVVTTPAGERLTGDKLVWDLRTGRLDVTGAQ
jgi:LPS export ABC transporter protein LptC